MKGEGNMFESKIEECAYLVLGITLFAVTIPFVIFDCFVEKLDRLAEEMASAP